MVWVYVAFVTMILALLVLDLGVINRKAHVIGVREALGWSTLWISLGLAFGGLIYLGYEQQWFGLGTNVDLLVTEPVSLERLREQGYQVFHDIPAEGFNIDHVCIGPAGVFTIETKTWSKPLRGDARVRWDGERLTVNGAVPERDPVRQAQGQARWLARLIEDSAGRKVPVQPVIVFPVWFVESSPGGQQPVWVMEPKGLPAFLQNEPRRLRDEDAKLCVSPVALCAIPSTRVLTAAPCPHPTMPRR